VGQPSLLSNGNRVAISQRKKRPGREAHVWGSVSTDPRFLDLGIVAGD
jgi:hypothetical protein